jgi:hypothetical protein
MRRRMRMMKLARPKTVPARGLLERKALGWLDAGAEGVGEGMAWIVLRTVLVDGSSKVEDGESVGRVGVAVMTGVTVVTGVAVVMAVVREAVDDVAVLRMVRVVGRNKVVVVVEG